MHLVLLLAQESQDIGNPILAGAIGGAVFGGMIGAVVALAVWGVKKLTSGKPKP